MPKELCTVCGKPSGAYRHVRSNPFYQHEFVSPEVKEAPPLEKPNSLFGEAPFCGKCHVEMFRVSFDDGEHDWPGWWCRCGMYVIDAGVLTGNKS